MKNLLIPLIVGALGVMSGCKSGGSPSTADTCPPGCQCAAKVEEPQKKKAAFGIDVSHHNGKIDWAKLGAEQELEFVYVKATEGASYTDKRYLENVHGASEAGYKVGSYHFFRMTSGAHDQFRNFDGAMKAAGHQTLIPMVDVETADKHPVSELRDSLRVFIRLMKEHYGVAPMIYGTNKSYNQLCGSSFNGYYLYIGRYGANPPIISGQGHYTIWQYSEKGHLAGIPKPVDMARFHPDNSITDILMP